MTRAEDDEYRHSRETLHALQTFLLSVEGVQSFLQEVAELAAQILTPTVSCGITTEHDGHPLTVASSDYRAKELDESQYATGEGSCLYAMRSGEIVDVADASSEARWPDYLARAREQGLRSSLSLPLLVEGVSVGAMNLYNHDRAHAFGRRERTLAEGFAAQVSTALLLALRMVRHSAVQAQLERALTSRSVIDQALGVLMCQQRCTAEKAFEILRAHSQNNNTKLREVAATLIADTTGSPPSDGHPFHYPAPQGLRGPTA